MILQLNISLNEKDPAIWRRIEVNENIRMDRLHQVIQIAMGWDNKHLHEFIVGDRRIGMIEHDFIDDPQPNEEEETKIFLKELDIPRGGTFRYVYDFGDTWEHVIQVETIWEGDLFFPKILGGEGACPPEDCGGTGHYLHILNILNTPEDPAYDHWKEWWPEDFDPNEFDIDEVNEELKKFGKWDRNNPTAKSTPWHRIE